MAYRHQRKQKQCLVKRRPVTDMLVKRTKEGAEVMLTHSTASIAAVTPDRTCVEGKQADRQQRHFIQVDACIKSLFRSQREGHSVPQT